MDAWVTAAQQGDADAFGELVKRNANLVCSITTAILRDRVRGEDVAQDVFLAAWKNLRTLRNPDSFRPWLRQLARNRSRDALRSQNRTSEVSTEALGGHPDTAVPIDEALTRRQVEQALWTTVTELSSDQAEVLLLFYREDQSIAHVSQLLDLSEATVRKRLSRARASLRSESATELTAMWTATRPGPEFIAGVTVAIVAAAPATSWAGGAVLSSTAPVLGAAAGGLASGITGIGLGYHYEVQAGSDRLLARRMAGVQVLGVLAALSVVLLMDGLMGSVLCMLILGLFLGLSLFLPPYRARRLVGYMVGMTLGTLGAAYGASSTQDVSFLLALAVHVQVQCFITVPIVASAMWARRHGLRWRGFFVGMGSWWIAAPFIAAGSTLAVSMSSHPLAGAVGLSIAAGCAEESIRMAWLAILERWRGPLNRKHAALLGLGHGGTEAILFGTGALFMVSGGTLATPVLHGGMGVSRLLILSIHVGWSVLAWHGLRTRWWTTLAFAITTHVTLDLMAFCLPTLWPAGGLGATASVLAIGAILSATAATRRK